MRSRPRPASAQLKPVLTRLCANVSPGDRELARMEVDAIMIARTIRWTLGLFILWMMFNHPSGAAAIFHGAANGISHAAASLSHFVANL